MFASALQKRKAVALSQPPPQPHAPQQQEQQQHQHQHALSATVARSGFSATAAAAATQPTLSELLAKRQKTEASAATSGFTTARQLGRSTQVQQQQQTKAKAKVTTTAKRTAPAKSRASKARTQAQQSDEQESVVFELSTKRRVTVRKWRSAVLVDIREFYDDDGVSKPGKKGISLGKEQWLALLRLAPAIDEAILLVEDDNVDEHSLQDVEERISADSKERTIAFTLSSKRRISVRFFRSGVLVDLREFYDQDGVQKPGKKGIALSKEQWRALCGAQQEVSEAASQL